MTEHTLSQANKLIKAGDKKAAKRLITAHLKDNPYDEEAWTLLYFCLERPEHKRKCLEKILQINPGNQKAHQALLSLAESPGQAAPLEAPALLAGDLAKARPTSPPVPGSKRRSCLQWALLTLLAAVLLATAAALAVVFVFPNMLPEPVGAQLTQVSALLPGLGPGAPGGLAATPPTGLEVSDDNNLQITYITYGAHTGGEAGGQEYVIVTNLGSQAIELSGWKLVAGDGAAEFIFPTFRITPSQSCRVYSNYNDPGACGFSFDSDAALWESQDACGYLYNPRGELISEYCFN